MYLKGLVGAERSGGLLSVLKAELDYGGFRYHSVSISVGSVRNSTQIASYQLSNTILQNKLYYLNYNLYNLKNQFVVNTYYSKDKTIANTIVKNHDFISASAVIYISIQRDKTELVWVSI